MFTTILGVVLVVAMATQAESSSSNEWSRQGGSQRSVSKSEVRQMLRSMMEEKGGDMQEILPLLFLLNNSGHFLRCTVPLVMAAATLGGVVVSGWMSSPLHN